MDEGRVHLVARLRLEVSSGEDGQDFTKSSPGYVKSGDNDAATAPTGAYHLTQVAERGLHIKHGAMMHCHQHPLEALVCSRWADP